ncbi:hypothetical protein MPSEU_000043900 [Mayamaea pseudoterrestris]|nr:hypothetical protein MPSEU_000043900 [Mayamaea pseudoterrestris]
MNMTRDGMEGSSYPLGFEDFDVVAHHNYHPRQQEQQQQQLHSYPVGIAPQDHGARSISLDDARQERVCLPVKQPHEESSHNEEPPPKKAKRLCRFPGCIRVIKSQGHCQRHGAKVKRCRIEGCDKQAQGTHDGMCKRHWTKYSAPLASQQEQQYEADRHEQIQPLPLPPQLSPYHYQMQQPHNNLYIW